MAGRIAGITIEIGGNTSKLQSALKGVDSKTKALKSSLRDIDRLLRFNPASTTLLAQKQQTLKNAIQQTTERLRTLKEAQAQMDAKGVDKNSEEYQRLQREIIATEQELQRLNSEYSKVASVAGVQLQAAGQKMQDFGRKIGEVGASLNQNVTAPLMAMAGVSIAAFKNVDKGMDVIVAKTGASGEALENMKNIAKDLATEIPTDFETAGAAVGEVNTRFKLTGGELQELSGKFIKFAALNNTDVSTSIDAVQSAMAAFGLSADQAGAYLDTLNAVGQQTGADVNKLAQDMVTNAAAFKEMGFSASDAAHFLGELSVNGIDSSQVMSGLKKAFAEATKEGKPLDQALAELQETMKNADSDTEAYAAALDLFGNRAGPALAEAIRSGRLSLEQLGTSIEDNVGNVDKTFAQTLDPVDEFKMALNEAKLAAAELGKAILSRLTPFIQKAQGYIKNLTTRFKEMSPAQKDAALKAAAFAAALGPILTAVGKVSVGLGAMTKAAGKALTGIKAIMAGTAGAGPLIALAAAAVGAGVAMYQLHQKTKEAQMAQHGLTEEQRSTIDALTATTEAYNQANEARIQATEAIVADAQYSHDLANEYNSLVDSNGQIKAGYEDRANFIKGQLAEALGVEKSKIDELIGANGQLDGSIHQLIETKKAEALLDANKDAYAQAIQARKKAVEELGPALQTLKQRQDEVSAAEDKVAQAQQRVNNATGDSVGHQRQYKMELENAKTALEGANAAYDEAKGAVDGYTQTIDQAATQIQNYEGLAAALAANDTAAIQQWAASLSEGIKTRTNATQTELQEQARILTEQYNLIKQAYDAGQQGITADMVAQAQQRMQTAQTEAGAVGNSAATEKNAVTSNIGSAQRSASADFQKIASAASSQMSNAAKSVVDSTTGIKKSFPVNLGQLFKGTLVNITTTIKEKAGGAKDISQSASYSNFAKGYTNPYLFTSPALLAGNRVVGDRGSQAGGELVYGKDNLMNDIRAAANPISAQELYSIISAAIDHADMSVYISGREFARLVREV